MSDDLLQECRRALETVKALTTRVGLRYIDLPPAVMGVGIAIAFGETDYVTVGSAFDNEHQVAITSGVLRDVRRDRLAALDACNRCTQDNPAYPVYLHDAEIGWDVHTQVVYPLGVMLQVPDFYAASVRNLPVVAQQAREKIAEKWESGGVPYALNDDVNRLLLRSMM